jgi:hypothetical protein
MSLLPGVSVHAPAGHHPWVVLRDLPGRLGGVKDWGPPIAFSHSSTVSRGGGRGRGGGPGQGGEKQQRVVSATKAQVQVIKVGYQGPCVVLATTTGSFLRVNEWEPPLAFSH